MIVKTFSKSGGGSSCIDYLADGNKESENLGENEVIEAEYDEDGNRLVTRLGATLLSGDLELTQELINQASAKFKNGYTAGVLSFEEGNISMAEKLAIMESFEEAILPGIEREDFDISWIEHTDKGRLELNFVIPRIHLSTEAHLQPYFHDIDQGRIKHWQEATNAKYGYSSPDEPTKQVSITPSFKDSKSRKEIKEGIGQLLKAKEPKTREDVISFLNDLDGVEVVREVKKSISIKVEDHDKNIRLTGAYFEQDFRRDKYTDGTIQAEQERFDSTRGERVVEHGRAYQERLQTARARNREKYSRIQSNIDKRNQRKIEQVKGNVNTGNERDRGVPNPSNFVHSDEFLPTQRNNEATADNRQVGEGIKHGLVCEREDNQSVQRRAEKEATTRKIEEIFNDQRANIKNSTRGNETGINAISGVTAQSTRDNQDTARKNRQLTSDCNRNARGVTEAIKRLNEKAGGWIEKKITLNRAKFKANLAKKTEEKKAEKPKKRWFSIGR